MNRKSSQIILVLVLITIGLGCSRKKDKWVNRTWHDITTKNNTLYNGRLSFDKGKEEVIQTYKENYWDLLPIERMIVSEDVRLPSEVLNKNFDIAEEKAVKAIQKHSMLIRNKERNPKIDEAFLLLGKSRYYEQRFIPAIEAFNYILYKYPTSNTINHAKVWRAKTNLRLDYNEKAIEDLAKMINEEAMKPQDYADAVAMISQAYINLKMKDSAVTYINKAAMHTRSSEEKGRYLYIKGQLFNELGQKDSANYAFDQIIDLNRRTPRHYLINAHMAKARNFDYEEGNKEEFLELLTDLEENRENRPFLDKIYNQKAVYFKSLDSIDLAIQYYNKSLRTHSEDEYLESLNYITLGNFSFDDKEYAKAGAYYDSTLQRMIVDSKRFRVLKKKRDNLDDVILYDGIARTNDSILNAVAMSPQDRLAYYSEYTEKLKAVAIAAEEAAEVERIKSELPIEQKFKQPGPDTKSKNPDAPKKFYFYNPTTLAYGKTSFKKIYGNRELQDNWRVSSISNPNAIKADNEDEEKEEYSIETDPTFDPQTYIAQLPTDPVIIDSLQTDRNFAYYQLGVIYKEKFLEYDLAIDKFENLLDSNPEERLIIPSKYNLYKIHTAKGDIDQANLVKQDIISNHGDSRYAKILLNPEEVLKDDENSPESRYNKLYKDFVNQKYAYVIKESNELITKFGGEDDFVAKFELLKAQAIGRYRGFTAYKEALNYVSLNYPQSPEGKKAQLIYQTTIPQIESRAFVEREEVEDNNLKLLYVFSTEENSQAIELKELLDVIIKQLKYYKMKTSLDIYTESQQFVVVHTGRDKLGVDGFTELLSLGMIEDERGVDFRNRNRKKKYFPKVVKEGIIVSSPNYRILQIHKNLEEYISQQQEEVEEPK